MMSYKRQLIETIGNLPFSDEHDELVSGLYGVLVVALSRMPRPQREAELANIEASLRADVDRISPTDAQRWLQ